jgi:hypothetical protein
MPGLIEQQRQQALEDIISDPSFHQGDHTRVQQVLNEMTSVQTELEDTFERWEALEGETP